MPRGVKGTSMPPKCPQCGETDVEKFYPSGRERRGHWCAPCSKARTQHRVTHPENARTWATKRSRANYELVWALKEKRGGCERCGWNEHPCALDFHHMGDKKYNIGRITRTYAQDTIMTEIEKCALLCANCHRMEHFARERTGAVV